MDVAPHLEETCEEHVLETTRSTKLSKEDGQPVEIVNDPPNQVTETTAKPKYRLVILMLPWFFLDEWSI